MISIRVAMLMGTALLLSGSAYAAEPDVAVGKKCFDQYVALEAKYDPAAIGMIKDDAIIEITDTDAGGKPAIHRLDAVKFKQAALASLPESKKEHEQDLYKDVKIMPENGLFRVHARDYSVTHRAEAKVSMLIGPDAKGACGISELKAIMPVLPPEKKVTQ